MNFANTFFTEYLWATASGLLARIEKQDMPLKLGLLSFSKIRAPVQEVQNQRSETKL